MPRLRKEVYFELKKSVVIGMSGGVDSSVSAAWMKQKGYEVYGVTLRLTDRLCGSCGSCSKSDGQQAHDLCRNLGFGHEIIDAQDEFFDKVVSRFGAEYAAGRTPNPCVLCNRFIKFPTLLAAADRIGYEYVATGHYANVEFDPQSGRYLLKKSANVYKDQTYVLYSLTQDVLSRVVFPLGNTLKSRVKEYAADMNFESAARKESQDICFIKDGDYAGFLKNKLGINAAEGDFVDMDGKFLGRHNGIINYTIGQRKGLGIASDRPYYVVAKDFDSNTVILGREEDLYSDLLIASDVNLISVQKLEGNMRVTVKTRYSTKEAPAEIARRADGTIEVKFDSPQRAVTSGQAVVFYDGDIVVGGGTIV